MLNRRDFLLRAGQVGYALAIVGPSLEDLLWPTTASAEELSAQELLTDAPFAGFRLVRPLKQPSADEIEKFFTLYLSN